MMGWTSLPHQLMLKSGRNQKEIKLATASSLILTCLILCSLCQAECQLDMPQLLWSIKYREL